MPEETSKITIISDLLKRDPAYKQVIDQLEERLYNRYMVYLADKPRFNAKTQAIPKQYLAQILSFKNTLELSRIAKKYNLSQEQRDAMPAIMWKIFWREADIKNLPQMLNSEAAINNIHTAYLLAGDAAQIYMPISDYLGDIPMVIKRWQYEIPAEAQPTTYNLQPTMPKIVPPPMAVQVQATPSAAAQPTTAAPAVPPIRPTAPSIVIPSISEESRKSFVAGTPQDDRQKIATLPPVARDNGEQKDESIARVQETMARISGQMAKIQSPPVITAQAGIQPKSEIEPEYLPDEKTVHSANVIDLKNF